MEDSYQYPELITRGSHQASICAAQVPGRLGGGDRCSKVQAAPTAYGHEVGGPL